MNFFVPLCKISNMEIVFIVSGIVVGLVIGLLLGKLKTSALSAKYEMKQGELVMVNKVLSEVNEETHELNRKIQEERDRRLAEVEAMREKMEAKAKEDTARQLKEQKAQYEQLMEVKDRANTDALRAQEKRHEEAVSSLKAQFDTTMEKVTAQVKTATDSMLKERQKEFAENSNLSLGQIVNPLRETIDKMKKAMEENTEKQTSMGGEMKANIEHMMRQSIAAKESADELARVFKHGAKVQGDWGETVLDELLQSQGLTNGIHYDTQTTIKDADGSTVRTEEGSIMRPDVILHLDQRRELIIDSKVSLTAFMDYVNAETEPLRQHFLKAHVESIQKHVKELSAKDYSSYIQPPKVKMDYVIMFVPHTGALWSALNVQPDLWRKAMEKNVFIADQQTLFAALRIINLTWTQIVQAQNHEKVYALANEMLNRVGQFWREYQNIGKALQKATEAYEGGRKKITDGGPSINTTANQLIKLGAKQSDKNPLPSTENLNPSPSLPQGEGENPPSLPKGEEL